MKITAYFITWALVHSLWVGLIFWSLTRIVTYFSPKAAHRRIIRIVLLLLLPLAVFQALPPLGASVTTQSAWLILPTENLLVNSPDWNELTIQWIGNHAGIICSLWLTGMLVGSFRFFQGHKKLKAYQSSAITYTNAAIIDMACELSQKLGISRKVRILTSALVNSPMTTGVFKPVIYLPIGLICGFSNAEIEAIVQHELAHIKRHDFMVNSFLVVLETVFFFNPMILLMARDLRQEMEYACDDLVIQNTHYITYSRALLKLQEMNLSPQIAMAARNSNSQFKQRIERMINSKNTPARPQWAVALVGLAILVAGSAFVQPKAETPEKVPELIVQDTVKKTDTLFFTSSEQMKEQLSSMEEKDFKGKVIMLNDKVIKLIYQEAPHLERMNGMMEEIHDELIKDGIIGEHKRRVVLMFQYSDLLNGKATLGDKYEKYKAIFNKYYPKYDSFATTRGFSYPKPVE